MRIASRFLIGVLVLGTLSCVGNDEVSRSIAEVVKRGDGARLTLVEHTPFAWDKVCIFAPYTSADRIETATGIPGSAKDAHGIESNDGVDALLFVRGGRIVVSVGHPANRGEFGPEVVGKCYSKEQAVFAVRTPPADTWGRIGPSM